MIPRVADHFELLRLVGEGSYGKVYFARDERAQGHVAVKLLHGAESAAEQRFEREASLLAGMEHPSIVRYVASGRTSDGQSYLAMEWLEGETLEQRLRSRPALSRGPLVAHEVHRGGARLRGGERRRAPRHQAGQPDARRRQRCTRQDPRLRPGAPTRRLGGRHAQRHRGRHSALYVPRAGARPSTARCALGRLLSGRGALRVRDRGACVRCVQCPRHARADLPRAARAHRGASAEHTAQPGAPDPRDAREGPCRPTEPL